VSGIGRRIASLFPGPLRSWRLHQKADDFRAFARKSASLLLGFGSLVLGSLFFQFPPVHVFVFAVQTNLFGL
jgi:hypothetical protein